MPVEDERSRPELDAGTHEQGPDTVAPPLDELFSALADRTRHRTLRFLLEESRTTTGELADVLLGREVSGNDVAGAEERERIRVSLRHVHLPKLADVGLVEYDPDGGEVEVEPVSGPVRDLIRFGHRYERTTDTRDRE